MKVTVEQPVSVIEVTATDALPGGSRIHVYPVGGRGLPGPPGVGAVPTVYQQTTPSAMWTINHNLGYYPKVQVFSAGSVELMCDISHTSVNQVVINLNVAQSGFVLI